MIRRILSVTTVLMLFLPSTALHAQQKPSASEASAEEESREEALEELTLEAEELFRAGRYEEALDVLGQAYAIGKDPKTLYNIARVHEEQGNLGEAIDRYDQFIVAPGVELKNRRLAMKRASALREKVANSEPDPQPTKFEPVEDTGTAETERPADVTVAPLGTPAVSERTRPAPAPVQRSSNREAWRRIGIGFTALGVAAAGVGGVLGGLSLHGWNQVEQEENVDEAWEKADRASRLAAVADTFFISGAVLGLTGLSIAVASWPSADTSKTTARRTLELGMGPSRVQATLRF